MDANVGKIGVCFSHGPKEKVTLVRLIFFFFSNNKTQKKNDEGDF